MKKVLIVATVWGFFDFLKNDIKLLQANGFEVHCATNFRNVNKPITNANMRDLAIKRRHNVYILICANHLKPTKIRG